MRISIHATLIHTFEYSKYLNVTETHFCAPVNSTHCNWKPSLLPWLLKNHLVVLLWIYLPACANMQILFLYFCNLYTLQKGNLRYPTSLLTKNAKKSSLIIKLVGQIIIRLRQKFNSQSWNDKKSGIYNQEGKSILR